MSGIQIVQVVIAVAFAVALVAFVFTHRHKGSKARVRPPGGARPAPTATAKPLGHAGQDAGALLDVVLALRSRQAQWPEIMAALNPADDRAVQRLLDTIRGPHMFAPHTALAVIESACRATGRGEPAAVALEAAVRSMDKVVRFGD